MRDFTATTSTGRDSCMFSWLWYQGHSLAFPFFWILQDSRSWILQAFVVSDQHSYTAGRITWGVVNERANIFVTIRWRFFQNCSIFQIQSLFRLIIILRLQRLSFMSGQEESRGVTILCFTLRVSKTWHASMSMQWQPVTVSVYVLHYWGPCKTVGCLQT